METEELGRATQERGMNPPKRGDRFRCDSCGMELQVTADCKCQNDDHMHFQCCGQEMRKR